MKKYDELPSIWQVGICLMLSQRNEATKFISPTDTRILAAGNRYFYPYHDVIRQYSGVVHFASTAEIHPNCEHNIVSDATWLEEVDDILKDNSLDKTWKECTILLTGF